MIEDSGRRNILKRSAFGPKPIRREFPKGRQVSLDFVQGTIGFLHRHARARAAQPQMELG